MWFLSIYQLVWYSLYVVSTKLKLYIQVAHMGERTPFVFGVVPGSFVNRIILLNMIPTLCVEIFRCHLEVIIGFHSIFVTWPYWFKKRKKKEGDIVKGHSIAINNH